MVAVHSDDPALLALVDALYAPTRTDRPADHALVPRAGAGERRRRATRRRRRRRAGAHARRPGSRSAISSTRRTRWRSKPRRRRSACTPPRWRAPEVPRAGRRDGGGQVDARGGPRAAGLGLPDRRGRGGRRRRPGPAVRQAVLARHAAGGPRPSTGRRRRIGALPRRGRAGAGAGARRGGRGAGRARRRDPPPLPPRCARRRSPSSRGRRAGGDRRPRLRALASGALPHSTRSSGRAVLPGRRRGSRRCVRRGRVASGGRG